MKTGRPRFIIKLRAAQDQEAEVQTVREMADKIIAAMMDWDMPKIRGARFDEATRTMLFEIDLAKPLFELRFEVPNCAEIGSAKAD